ncbi:hypothetical protein [Humidisolicoccus flavus]|uniref:hypothetical protein n=1 Tax=Humidisolicoccus flavus TaxID=3111414 RepID=UPI00324B1B1B
MPQTLLRRSGVAVLLVAGLFGISACVPIADSEPQVEHSDNGQTLDELQLVLEGLEGLTITTPGTVGPNIKGNTGIVFDVTLDPDYVLSNPAGLIEFITESAWSVNDGEMPNTTVEILYHGVPEDELNLAAVAADAGWLAQGSVPEHLAENGFSRVPVPVDDYAEHQGVPENAERLGSWPGDVPETPTDLVTPREA